MSRAAGLLAAATASAIDLAAKAASEANSPILLLDAPSYPAHLAAALACPGPMSAINLAGLRGCSLVTSIREGRQPL